MSRPEPVSSLADNGLWPAASCAAKVLKNILWNNAFDLTVCITLRWPLWKGSTVPITYLIK